MSDGNSNEPVKPEVKPMPQSAAFSGALLLGLATIVVLFFTLMGAAMAGEGNGKAGPTVLVFGALMAGGLIYCCIMTARSRTWNSCLLYLAIALGISLLLFGMCIGVTEYISR